MHLNGFLRFVKLNTEGRLCLCPFLELFKPWFHAVRAPPQTFARTRYPAAPNLTDFLTGQIAPNNLQTNMFQNTTLQNFDRSHANRGQCQKPPAKNETKD